MLGRRVQILAPAHEETDPRRAALRGNQTNEAHLSTLQACSQAPSRFPCPHGHKGWPQHYCCPPQSRPQASFGLGRGPFALAEQAVETQAIGRLTKRAEFLAARGGEKRRGKLFLLEVRDRKDGGPPRLGITVTRKVGNAVVRNRIRRRIREAVRQFAGNDMAAGNDYVVVGRNDVLDAPFEALKRELSRRIRGARQGPGISDGKQP